VRQFYADGGQVVIYDANNGTVARRDRIREEFGKELGVHVMFLGACRAGAAGAGGEA
jgi:hypothetical protein